MKCWDDQGKGYDFFIKKLILCQVVRFLIKENKESIFYEVVGLEVECYTWGLHVIVIT
jgi:hypothetical protein